MPKTPGEAAYNAWLMTVEEFKATAVGNAEQLAAVADMLDVFNALQKFIPTWEDLPPVQKDKWEAVASAAIEFHKVACAFCQCYGSECNHD